MPGRSRCCHATATDRPTIQLLDRAALAGQWWKRAWRWTVWHCPGALGAVARRCWHSLAAVVAICRGPQADAPRLPRPRRRRRVSSRHARAPPCREAGVRHAPLLMERGRCRGTAASRSGPHACTSRAASGAGGGPRPSTFANSERSPPPHCRPPSLRPAALPLAADAAQLRLLRSPADASSGELQQTLTFPPRWPTSRERKRPTAPLPRVQPDGRWLVVGTAAVSHRCTDRV
jgi:hypothetical protein